MLSRSRHQESGLRWIAQIDGKFIQWKKLIIDDDEILALREAIIDLQDKFGFLTEIEVRAFVYPTTGYKDIPVHLYIENHGNVENLRQEVLDYREEQMKVKQKTINEKDDFPFLMFDKDKE